MSKMKDLFIEIEVLYDAGISETEIARRLNIPIGAVRAVTDAVDEMAYHVDMREGYDREVMI